MTVLRFSLTAFSTRNCPETPGPSPKVSTRGFRSSGGEPAGSARERLKNVVYVPLVDSIVTQGDGAGRPARSTGRRDRKANGDLLWLVGRPQPPD